MAATKRQGTDSSIAGMGAGDGEDTPEQDVFAVDPDFFVIGGKRGREAMEDMEQRRPYKLRAKLLSELFRHEALVADSPLVKIGTPRWKAMAKRVDAALAAAMGKADMIVVWRMVLLECISRAVNGSFEPFDQKASLNRLLCSSGAVALDAGLDIVLKGYNLRDFLDRGELDPKEDVVQIIALDFSMRCPEHSKALRSLEASAALAQVVRSWNARSGRPKKGQTHDKWHDVLKLLKAVRLVSPTDDSLKPESLRREWADHCREKKRKKG
ncbi:MAG TPA: hypothetical protein VFS43_13380 [Polyangiaceae bacterium]|nr:hypothetical protein [Polyangiaceae bacterium]